MSKTVKIKMKTLDAGPSGVRHPNVEYSVDPEEARQLVEGGYASLVDAVIPQRPKPQKPETPEDKKTKPITPEKSDASKPEKQPEEENGFVNPFFEIGISEEDAELMVAGDIQTVDDLVHVTEKSLIEIKDIGKVTAKRIMSLIDPPEFE